MTKHEDLINDLLGAINGDRTSRMEDVLKAAMEKRPHVWDYSKTTPECKRCKIKWEHNASPADIKLFLTPTCPLTTKKT